VTPPAPVADAASARRLRALFAEAGFSAERVQNLLGTGEQLVARSTERPVYERRLGGDLLSTLIKLFVLGLRPPRTALDAPQLELLFAARLVEDKGEKVAGTVRVIPHEELLIASDFAGGDDAEHVAAVHRPSQTLARLTVRHEVGRALDVGTGNGIQALLLSRHARHVVATDLNERALEFARFNVLLNGVENVELRRGSYLEPVVGERFGLVVANPPYVISPESRYLFRDSGLTGDTVSEQLVRGVPSSLDEGGFATVMISWAQLEDDPTERPRTWLAGSGCDAYLIHTRTEDPLSTAAAWNRDLAARTDEYARAIDEWTEYYAREGIPAIAYGAIVLRRRSAAENWFEATRLPQRGIGPADAFLRRVFETLDALADAPLEERTVRVADDARLEQVLRLDGGWTQERLTIRLTDGLPFDADLDPYSSALVRRLDGSRPLRRAIEEAAAELELDSQELAPGAAALVREMAARGFLSVTA